MQNSVHCYFATLQHLTDVEDVKFVINYDYPNSSEDYIHRIGRTARSTKTGTAYTFFTPNNIKQVSDLISVLREANQAINPKLLQLVEDRGSGKGKPSIRNMGSLGITILSTGPRKNWRVSKIFKSLLWNCKAHFKLIMNRATQFFLC